MGPATPTVLSGYDDRTNRPGLMLAGLIVDPIAEPPGMARAGIRARGIRGRPGVWLIWVSTAEHGWAGYPEVRGGGPRACYEKTRSRWKATRSFQVRAVHTEGLINLDRTPDGSVYIALPVKHENSPTVETRAVAITNPTLASRLLEAVKAKRVVDLSVTLSMEHPVWWPGRGVGRHVFPYTRWCSRSTTFDGPSDRTGSTPTSWTPTRDSTVDPRPRITVPAARIR